MSESALARAAAAVGARPAARRVKRAKRGFALLAVASLGLPAPAAARQWHGHSGFHGPAFHHGHGFHSHGFVGSVFIDPFFLFPPYRPYYVPYAYPAYPYPVYPVPPPPDVEAEAPAPESRPGESYAEREDDVDVERASYGLLKLRGVPDGASVDLDGRFWLTAEDLDDRWLALPEGSHTLAVRARGTGVMERRIEVKAGQSRVVDFKALRGR